MKSILRHAGDPARGDEAQADRRTPYEPPRLTVIREDELLELVGPAQAYSGPVAGTTGGGSF